MPVLTIYPKNAAVSGFGSLQVGGAAPATATTGTGWTVGKTASTNYSFMLFGSKRAAGTFSGTSPLASSTGPSSGSAWRTENVLDGSFASGSWVFDFPFRAVDGGGAQDGRVRLRVWKSVSADGSSPTQITTAVLTGTTVTNLTTTTDQTSSVTWSAPSFALNGEYLFVEAEWEITGAGSANNQDVVFRVGSTASITTTNFDENTVVPVSGVSASGAVGDESVMGQSNTSVSGTGSTASLGNVIVTGLAGERSLETGSDLRATEDGGARVTEVYDPSGNVSVEVLGEGAAGAVGSVDIGTGIGVFAVGSTATGHVGIVSIIAGGSIEVPVSGAEASALVGSISVGLGQIVYPDGVVAAGAFGSVSTLITVDVELTGASADGLVGSVDFTLDAILTVNGLDAVSAVGSVEVIAINNTIVTLTGVAATGLVGAFTVWGLVNDQGGTEWRNISFDKRILELTDEVAFRMTEDGLYIRDTEEFVSFWQPVNDTQATSWTNVG